MTSKKSIGAALLVAALTVGLAGPAAYAKGLDLNIKSDGNVEHSGHSGNANVSGSSDLQFFVDHEDRFLGENRKENHREDRREDRKEDGRLRFQHDEDGVRNVHGVARVTAIASGTITATAVASKSDRTWTITTDADTDFSVRTGADADIDDVDEGDLISFRGTITDRDGSELMLDATAVRIWGDIDLASKAKVSGTVTAIDETDGQLVIQTENEGTVTVNTTDLTSVRDEDGDRSVFADIALGAEVRIKGWWDSLKETITAVKVRIL